MCMYTYVCVCVCVCNDVYIVRLKVVLRYNKHNMLSIYVLAITHHCMPCPVLQNVKFYPLFSIESDSCPPILPLH